MGLSTVTTPNRACCPTYNPLKRHPVSPAISKANTPVRSTAILGPMKLQVGSTSPPGHLNMKAAEHL